MVDRKKEKVRNGRTICSFHILPNAYIFDLKLMSGKASESHLLFLKRLLSFVSAEFSSFAVGTKFRVVANCSFDSSSGNSLSMVIVVIL